MRRTAFETQRLRGKGALKGLDTLRLQGVGDAAMDRVWCHQCDATMAVLMVVLMWVIVSRGRAC